VISPEAPTDLLSSANFLSLSVSSSDHAPWFTPAAAACDDATTVALVAAGAVVEVELDGCCVCAVVSDCATV
jgi:hypothetical protein